MTDEVPRQPQHDDVERIDGVSLEEYAAISAVVAEGTRPFGDVLADFRLTDKQWGPITLAWMQRIALDVQTHRELAKLPTVFSDAFARAQDRLAPLPPLTVEDWAALTLAVLTHGSPGPALKERQLTTPDYIRLSRHFASLLSSDPVAGRRYERAFLAMQPREPA